MNLMHTTYDTKISHKELLGEYYTPLSGFTFLHTVKFCLFSVFPILLTIHCKFCILSSTPATNVLVNILPCKCTKIVHECTFTTIAAKQGLHLFNWEESTLQRQTKQDLMGQFCFINLFLLLSLAFLMKDERQTSTCQHDVG